MIVLEGQDVLAYLVHEPERAVIFVLLLHGHREPESRLVLAFDSRGDEGPQLEGLQFLVAGSFKNGDVDVKVRDLLVDRVLVL